MLGVEPSHADAELVEWEDWEIVPTDREHALTRGLHVGFRAPTREAVDAFWQAGIDAGPATTVRPGRARTYRPDYYGGFLLDPDGNSVEAVHDVRARPVPAAASTTCGSALPTPRRPSASTRRSRRTRGSALGTTSPGSSTSPAATTASR